MIRLPAYAKINWKLDILGKREDGFHELCTIFQTVSLCDQITFEESSEISLSCDSEAIPKDENNLIIKAALALKEKSGVLSGAKIHLEKMIPSPGGLGGGSSDAAIALLGLAKLWKLTISFHELLELGSKLGSDIPFFLYGGTALGTGRGTMIKPLPDAKKALMLIVTPDESISTRDAFERLKAPGLTNDEAKSKFIVCCKEGEAFDLLHSTLKNDFEESVFASHPEVKRVRDFLIGQGADKALMAGSGASVFGIFDNENSRRKALGSLKREDNWRSFAAETISREAYRKSLMPCNNLLSE